MTKQPSQPIHKTPKALSETEALQLASNLKSKILSGKCPSSKREDIEQIIAGLGDRRGLLRRTFAESLGLIGKPAIPFLIKALVKSPNVVVRRAAAKSLKLVGDPIALPDLIFALTHDHDPVVQGSAAGAIAIFGEEAVEPLLEILINPKSNSMQCGLATWGLSFIGAKAHKAIRKAAISPNHLIRAAAISAMGEQIQSLEDSQSKDILITALDDTDIDVRIEATKLAAKLKNKKLAYQLISQKLIDSNSEVRKYAALSFMKLPSQEAIELLRERLSLESISDVLNVIKMVINKLERDL